MNKVPVFSPQVTVVGPLPPIRGGVSGYCYCQVKSLIKHINVDYITYKKIYPSFLFPGESFTDKLPFFDEISNSNKIQIKKILHWGNPFTWIMAGLSVKSKIVHVHWWTYFLFPPLFSLILIAKLRKKIIILTAHNVMSHESNLIDYIFSKAIFKIADQILVHSEENKKQLVEKFNIFDSNIHVVKFGNYDFFSSEDLTKEQARKILKIPINVKIILFFGTIREYKGLDILIKSFAKVIRKIPESRLLIAGESWVNWEPYRQLLKSNGVLSKSILHLGYVPQNKVNKYFISSDVVVAPYRHFESQSGAACIANQFAKPLIVTRTGGLPDLVTNKEFVVQSENIGELSEAIIKVLLNKKIAKKLSEQSKLTSEKHSWEIISKKTIKFYEAISSSTNSCN